MPNALASHELSLCPAYYWSVLNVLLSYLIRRLTLIVPSVLGLSIVSVYGSFLLLSLPIPEALISDSLKFVE